MYAYNSWMIILSTIWINKPFTYSDYEVTSALRREIENARSHFEGYADIPEAIKEMLNDLYDNN